MIKKPFMIAISSPSGGGKTALATLLQEKLSNSTLVFFDDYDFSDDPGNDQFDHPLVKFDFERYELAALKNDLLALRQSAERDFVILDYPFSYCNSKISPFIDLSVYIDTPLDIAMARRVIRDFEGSAAEIKAEMAAYLKNGRVGYTEMQRQIKPSCDLILDGKAEFSEKLDILLKTLEQRIRT